MNADQIVTIINKFKWNIIGSMFGGSHSSIIGFISATWISLGNNYYVFDGAPSVVTNTGKRYADLLLCKNNQPFCVAEIETMAEKYPDKLRSIQAYLRSNNYQGLQFGLMVLTNLGKNRYEHDWDDLKSLIKNGRDNIALVSVEKRKLKPDELDLDNIKKRTSYYQWQPNNIEYWVYSSENGIRQGQFWKE